MSRTSAVPLGFVAAALTLSLHVNAMAARMLDGIAIYSTGSA